MHIEFSDLEISIESYLKALTKFTILIFKMRKDVWNSLLDNKTVKVLTVIYRLAFNKCETKTNGFANKKLFYTHFAYAKVKILLYSKQKLEVIWISSKETKTFYTIVG